MKIMVIDGNSILNRAFYGIRQLTNHEGLPTNAVYGFLATLFKLQDEEQPDRTIVCFDVKEKPFVTLNSTPTRPPARDAG